MPEDVPEWEGNETTEIERLCAVRDDLRQQLAAAEERARTAEALAESANVQRAYTQDRLQVTARLWEEQAVELKAAEARADNLEDALRSQDKAREEAFARTEAAEAALESLVASSRENAANPAQQIVDFEALLAAWDAARVSTDEGDEGGEDDGSE